MGQDGHQGMFRTTFSASIPRVRTGFSVSEPAIIRLGLLSIAAGWDYLHLTQCLVVPHPLAPRVPLSWYGLPPCDRVGETVSVSQEG